jgi:hypothetical protein
MASILDDLKGVLGDEAIAKIEANAALKTRVTRGDELRSYYDGDETTTTTTATTTTEPPPARKEPPAGTGGQYDLSAIERMLDAREAKQKEFIKTEFEALAKARGDELVNNAVKIAVQRTDELSRIYAEHNANYGEAFDSTKFNEYLEANKDKGFRSIRQAYDAWVAPRALDREVDRKVKEKLAAESGKNIPGTTPAPATNSNIRHFMKRTGTGATAGETGTSRAAAMLDRLEASRAANVA